MKKRIALVCFAFITLTTTAQQINWAKNIAPAFGGGRTTDVDVDAAGNIYAVGVFDNSGDFDPGPGVLNLSSTAAGKGNYFCVKYTSMGTLIWARQIGGTQGVFSTSESEFFDPKIAISNNRVIITGSYNADIDFDPGPGVYLIPPPYENAQFVNIFVASYTLDGNLVWAKGIDQAGNLSIRNVEVDLQNNIILAGGSKGLRDLDPSLTSTYYTSNPAGVDWSTFVLKLSPAGDFIWAREFTHPVPATAPATNYPLGLAVDNQNNVIITGYYQGTLDFDHSLNENISSSVNGSIDLYFVKYDEEGSFQWAHAIGGNSTEGGTQDQGTTVTTDDAGNIYLGGSFTKTIDMDPNPAAVANLTTTSGAIFVAKYSPEGTYIFAKGIEAFSSAFPTSEKLYDIAVDNIGNLYFTGVYLGTMDCDPDEGVYAISNSGGNDDIFVISYSSNNGAFNWAKSIGGTAVDISRQLVVSNVTQQLTVGGAFIGTIVDFDAPHGYNIQGNSLRHHGFLASYTTSVLRTIDYSTVKITLAPNPAENTIYIGGEIDIDSAFVYDLQGKKINVEVRNRVIDISILQEGIYILKLFSGMSENTFKIIKK